MNLFLPYENDVKKSVSALDNARLVKQILECKILLDGAIAYKNEEITNGYFKHPVAQHYKDYPEILAYYGYVACMEYAFRFSVEHQYFTYFREKIKELNIVTTAQPQFVPFYMEGPKDSIYCIRTTENVSKLFQDKLVKKWSNGKNQPRWTGRDIPDFYYL